MTAFSIIIPFKNEKDNLEGLIKSLLSQKTDTPFEVILIDDNSTDNGKEIVEKKPQVRLFHRKDFPDNPNISSKQNALDIGVSQANNNYLVFTDADMLFDENWLDNYAETIKKTGAEFVFGRTEIITDASHSFVAAVQSAQLNFLFALALLFCKLGLDGSAMGNNLAISKKLYEKIGGQAGLGYSLIEDKKLLSAARAGGVKIYCTNDFSAFAKTKPVCAKKFLQQMLRWVKGGFVESRVLSVSLVLFALLNLLILPSFLLIVLLLPVYLRNKISLKFAFLLPFIFFIETIILIPSLFFVKLTWKEITI